MFYNIQTCLSFAANPVSLSWASIHLDVALVTRTLENDHGSSGHGPCGCFAIRCPSDICSTFKLRTRWYLSMYTCTTMITCHIMPEGVQKFHLEKGCYTGCYTTWRVDAGMCQRTYHGSDHYVLSPWFDIHHTNLPGWGPRQCQPSLTHLFQVVICFHFRPEKMSHNVTNNPWTYDSNDSHNFHKNVVVWCFNVGNINTVSYF